MLPKKHSTSEAEAEILAPERCFLIEKILFMRTWMLVAVLLLLVAPAAPITTDEVPNPRKVDGNWVNDTAHLLDTKAVDRLNLQLTRMERVSGTEFAVATIDTSSRQCLCHGLGRAARKKGLSRLSKLVWTS